MRDQVIEEILKDRIPGGTRAFPEESPLLLEPGRRGYIKPSIPPANRYPHSVAREELERTRQPWNRRVLGSFNG
jgi:hypothetical protein